MDDEEQTPAGMEEQREEANREEANREEAGVTAAEEVVSEEAVSGQVDAGALWSVGGEAQRFFSATLDDTFLQGITGGALRHRAASLLRSDLTHWIAPGLAFCGVQAQIAPVPADLDACLQWLCANLQPGTGVCAFAFSETEDADASHPELSGAQSGKQIAANVPASRLNRGRIAAAQKDEIETERLALPRYTDPPLAWEARIVAVDADRREVTLLDSREHASPCTLPELQTYFSHIMALSKSSVRPRKTEQKDYALRAWTAFACAYPERLLDMGANDEILREQCADFWRGLAGRERSDAGQRLRDAADLFQNAQGSDDLESALRLLYKQTCYELRLPPLLENALLAPDDVILSEAERRELIYVARAGTRDLKILAAYRLLPESDQPDARATLLQLQHDPDAWVRAAARL